MNKITSPEGPRITIRVEPYVYEKLKVEAKDRGVPLATLFRYILTNSVTKLDPKHEEIIGRLVHLEEEILLHRRISCAAVTAISQLETSITQFNEVPNRSLDDIKDDFYTKTVQNALTQGDDLEKAITKKRKGK